MAKVILAMLLMIFATICKADLILEGSMGQTKESHMADQTLWMQPGMPTADKLRDRSYAFGAHWQATETFGLRLWYVNLGKIHANNVAMKDAEIGKNPASCNWHTSDSCPALFQGSGSIDGVSFGPTIGKRFGALTLQGETGLFVYRSSWQEHITPCASPSFDFEASNGRHRTSYVGAMARYDLTDHFGAFVSARRYKDVSEGGIGYTEGPAKQYLFGASITL